MKELESLMTEKGLDVVIVTDKTLETESAKQEIIKKFINDFKYESIYDKSGVKVWQRQGD
jgi:hypothetical protein